MMLLNVKFTYCIKVRISKYRNNSITKITHDSEIPEYRQRLYLNKSDCIFFSVSVESFKDGIERNDVKDYKKDKKKSQLKRKIKKKNLKSTK